MKIRRHAIKRPRVEMIPLIDTVFLILVFFIYAFLSMTVHRGLPVTLPAATTAHIDKQDYCAITVTADDRIFVNKVSVTGDALASWLRGVVMKNKDIRVYINADKAAHHGAVVTALDAVRACGIEKGSIETEKKEGA